MAAPQALRVLRSQLESLGIAATAPETLGQAAKAAETFSRQAPQVIGNFNLRPAFSLFSHLSSALLPRSPIPVQTLEVPAKWLGNAAVNAVGDSAQCALDGANDVFSALGLQIRIMSPSSPDAQVFVKVSSVPDGPLSPQDGVAIRLGITPREFVRFMRQARESGDINGVRGYIERLVAQGLLQPIPLLTALQGHKFYIDTASLVIFAFQRALLQLDGAVLLGHTLKVCSGKGFRSGLLDRDWSKSRRRGVGEQQLATIVDHMLADNSLRVWLFPRPFERRLFLNVMMVVFQLLEDLLTADGQEVDFFGHRVRFHLEPQSVDLLVHGFMHQRIPPCRANEAVLDELADELCKDAMMQIVWLPEIAHREMYKSILRLLLRIVEHIITSLNFSVLGKQVRMSLLSGEDARRQKEVSESRRSQAVRYSEESQPLRGLSTTELQERLKSLTEQRRVLEALKQLGAVRFDLTADAPMLDAAAAKEAEGTGAGDVIAQPAGSATSTEESPEDEHEFYRVVHNMKLARRLSVKCEVQADIEVPYSMIADLETYPLWMPWCTSGRRATGATSTSMSPVPPGGSAKGAVPEVRGFVTKEGHEFEGEVGFGFETGTFLGTVGDTVRYCVSVFPPTSVGEEKAENQPVIARVVANAYNGFTYGERLVYDWRFRRLGEGPGTQVELDMLFQAKSVLYMPLWDSMQHMVINKMLAAFSARAEQLQQQRKRAPHQSPSTD